MAPPLKKTAPLALSDKLMLTDILMHLKDLMTTSGMGIKEASCEKMRALLTKTSGQTAAHQFDLFKYMNTAGFYPVKNAPPADLKETIAMFSDC
jgi:spore coat protein CotF